MSIFPRPVTCPHSGPASRHQMSALSASQQPPDTQQCDQQGMLWLRSNVPADPTPPQADLILMIARKKGSRWIRKDLKMKILHWEYSAFMFWTRLTSRNLCNDDIRSLDEAGTNPDPALVSTCLWCPMSNANCENCGLWLQNNWLNSKLNMSWAKAGFHGRKNYKNQRKSSNGFVLLLKIFNIHLKEFNIGYSWIIIPNPTHRVWTGTNSFQCKFTLPCSSLESQLRAVMWHGDSQQEGEMEWK